jgi:hypothetical protein
VDSPLVRAKATAAPVKLASGLTVRLATGSRVSGVAYDPGSRLLYFTDSTTNAVRALNVDSTRVAPWAIAVGSKPAAIMFLPASGVRPGSLATYNSGGTDLSLVNLVPGVGGVERQRIVLPITTIMVGQEAVRATTTILGLTPYCLAAPCTQPTLFLGAGDNNVAVTRSIAVEGTDPNAGFTMLAPSFSTRLPQDSMVDVRVVVTDRQTTRDSVVFERSGVSKCGTLAVGGNLVATSEDPGGPIFVADRGTARTLCGSVGRVLRFDRGATRSDWSVSSQVAVSNSSDDRLRFVTGLAVNADASQVALLTEGGILVTDGNLRLLGTIPVDKGAAVAFLTEQRGGGQQWIAVSRGADVMVYETQHFQAVARLESARPLGRSLRFVLLDRMIGRVALIADLASGAGFFTLNTTLATLAAGHAQ